MRIVDYAVSYELFCSQEWLAFIDVDEFLVLRPPEPGSEPLVMPDASEALRLPKDWPRPKELPAPKVCGSPGGGGWPLPLQKEGTSSPNFFYSTPQLQSSLKPLG
jgi:hypothetical protein